MIVKFHMVQLFSCVYPAIEEAQQNGTEVLLWLQAEEHGKGST